MSAAKATYYVRQMHELETRGFGDDDNALVRLESMFGISFWTLRYLKQGRAKTVDADLLERIRAAYLQYCEGKVRKILTNLETDKALDPDAYLDDLQAEAAALAAKIAAAKAARLTKNRGRR